MSSRFGFEPIKYESAAKSEFKWVAPEHRAHNAGPDTRSAHFSLGGDEVEWASAAQATFTLPTQVERTAPVKPSGAANIVFGSSSVTYASTTSAAFAGSPPPVRDVPTKPARAQRAIVLGDDTPTYESEAMHQTRKGVASAGAAVMRPVEVKRGHAPAAIVFGSSAPEYTTSTGCSMSLASVSGAGPAKPQKQSGAAIVMGDDSVDYVTSRMSEEGLMSRQPVQRYLPSTGASCASALKPPTAAVVDTKRLAGVSWQLGSDSWTPQTSAQEYKWHSVRGSGPALPPKPIPSSSSVVQSNIHLGDDGGGSRFTSEAAGGYSVPDPSKGGRQAAVVPAGGSIDFGSDKVKYASASASAFASRPMDLTAARAELLALKEKSMQRGITLGDDTVMYESAAQQVANNGFLTVEGVPAAAPERRRGTVGGSIVFGSDAPEYASTTAAASVAVAVSKPSPRQPVARASGAIVFGNDSVDFVSARMGEEGSQTRTLGQRYKPRSVVPA